MAAKHKNEEGFAILEAVVFLISFMIVAVYTIDFFSAIHTGVLDSIQARTYLFETLRHRADIDLLRETPDNDPSATHFASDAEGHQRFHVVNDEDQPPTDSEQMRVVARSLTQADDEQNGNLGTGQLTVPQQGTSVMYIKSGYGICTDSQCKKDGG